MAIALVKMGSIVTTTSTTASPLFGQSTTAGNLLVARLASSTSGTWSTSSSGWTIAAQNIGIAIAYKANCGASETAPTFTYSTSGTQYADLCEFSGAATASPVDQTQTSISTVTSGHITMPSTEVLSGCLMVVSDGITNTKSATYTFADTWSPGGGTAVAGQDTGTTKAASAFRGSAYVLPSTTAGDLLPGVTPSTGSAGVAPVAVTFKPAVAQAVTYDPVISSQALMRAGNW